MDDAKWERYALLGGPIFVVLGVVGAFVAGSPPAPDASPEKVLKFFTDHDSTIGFGSFIGILAALFLLFWAGSLWRAMSRAEGERPRLAIVAAMGLVFAGAMASAGGAVTAALALRSDTLSPDMAHVFWAFQGTLAASIYIGMAVQVAAVSALAWHSGFLPKWLAGLGAVIVVAALVSTLGVASDVTFFFALALVTFLVWDVWILLTTWKLWTASATRAAAG